ncbi:TVP38/TMEM64 family protein [Thermincola ferriacetica]
MEEQLVHFFNEYQSQAVLISIILSIVVAIMGVLPSFFITAANITFFGFWPGTLISFIGEALGASISFIIYRKGLQHVIHPYLKQYPRLMKLINSTGREAVYLILLLRVMPLMPSGLVTLAASMGTISVLSFTVASSLGKIPALLLEAFSVYQIMKINRLKSWLLELILVYAIYRLWQKTKK